MHLEWIMFAHFEEMARISRGAGISVRTDAARSDSARSWMCWWPGSC